ncbi:hypothetical protein LRAMOSA05946 [Lichtheimia ramosa]|uniref:Uncharacterized protein n=1 Tax=Lichtheimia ramosa TaxID=688394 RepID=A0A077X434_9FUNG|nr:hypothetical protein LRAMOSA05946 [Lichtheimia ramosa]
MVRSSNMAMWTLRRRRSSSDMMISPTIIPTTTTGPSLVSSPLSPTSSSSQSSTTAFVAHHHQSGDSGMTRRHHLSTGSLPLDMQRAMSTTLQRYESELQFLRDQWTHICITSRSLRSSYDAVPHNNSDNNEDPNDEYVFPIPGTIAVDTFYVPLRRRAQSATNNNNTSRRGRGRTRGRPPRTSQSSSTRGEEQQLADEEIEYEMLLSLDDNLLQIRQLEVKIEQLEHKIQNIMRNMASQ